MKKIFSEAFEKASKRVAADMSKQLTRNAVRDGWHPDVAAGLTVSYSDGTFSSSHAPEHSTAVFDMEYGTETTAPKATIRKMQNSTKEISDRFSVLYEKILVKL